VSFAAQDTDALSSRAQELETSLLRLQRECSQAVAAAQTLVGRPTTPRGSPRSSEDGAGAVSVGDVVRHLVAKLKVALTFTLCCAVLSNDVCACLRCTSVNDAWA